ncbi:MAG: pentapeptide repeat-containing protein, partial [Acidobacteria bacterium]|nr:pentapeptide repeat-containing protein [Acidobacteriota bacterium]
SPATLNLARMRYTRAQAADLTSAILDGADLRGADLTGAKLLRTSFRDAEISSVIGMET